MQCNDTHCTDRTIDFWSKYKDRGCTLCKKDNETVVISKKTANAGHLVFEDFELWGDYHATAAVT